MQNINVSLTLDGLNIITQALNDSVVYRQQSIAMLINNLHSQANAQITPQPAQVSEQK